MVCRQHNQGVFKANPGINECQEFGQCAIQLQHHVLGFQTGRTKEMIDGIHP